MKKNLTRIVITIFLVVASIYFLYPTYKDYQLQQELGKLTGQDSISFVESHAQELKEMQIKRIKLGLDLKGGMYVVLDVDVVKLLEDLAKRKDDVLTSTLNELRAVSNETDASLIDLFKTKLQEKGQTLKSYYGELRDEDADVEERLKSEIDGALDRAIEVVSNRVNQYGVSEPGISKQGNSRIVVELPGVSNTEDVRQLLQGTALLEFKMVKDPESTIKVMQAINKVLAGDTSVSNDTTSVSNITTDSIKKEQTSITSTDTTKKTSAGDKNKKQDTTSNNVNKTANKTADTTRKNTNTKDTSKKTDTSKITGDTNTKTDTGTAQDTTQQLSEEEFIKKNPLFFTLAMVSPESGQADAYVKAEDRAKVERMLAREDVKAVIPSDFQFAWSQETIPMGDGNNYYSLIAVKKDPELTGKVITDAQSNIDPTSNQPVVTMQMSTEGAADWARITGANINKRCAIVLDNVVYSSPTIRNKITGGSSQIEGMGDIQEAKLLEIVLKAGALPAPLKIIEERTIGPSLGEDSIRAGINSSIAAIIVVALFMLVYYKFGGFVADFALVINVLFVLAIMASFQATLTLPGIAGLILTLGMAVDTNVLIYERIREELDSGKPLKTAIEIGYKRAFSAILDSHVTSVITGVILMAFGTGPIQGFAITLLMGIIVNLFTAIVITHFVFDIMLEKGKKVSFG